MNRSTIFLIALLLLLSVVAYFIIDPDNEREVSYDTPAVSVTVDSASVLKIEIKRPSETIVLENVGGKWAVTSPLSAAADPVAIAQLLSGFSRFKTGSLISSNPEKQHLFQVDSAGTRVNLYERSGKTTALTIGKMGPSFSEVYFRLSDSKDVYLASGIDSWTITKNLKEWRDRSIAHTPNEAVTDVSIAGGTRRAEFHRDSTGWISGGKPAEPDMINPILNTLSNLRADDFVDTLIDISSKPVTIDVRAAENITLNLYPILPDSAKYFVRSSKSTQLFVINKWTADQLIKPIRARGASGPAEVAESVDKEIPPVVKETAEKPARKAPEVTKEMPKKEPPKTPAAAEKRKVAEKTSEEPEPVKQSEPAPVTVKPGQKTNIDDEGELTIHVVKPGETMTSIARKYKVTAEQILKWNLLKSINVRPGQELYIYVSN